ncbi:hypothetical protein STEG23_026308, partial [Scotinomys teguina]
LRSSGTLYCLLQDCWELFTYQIVSFCTRIITGESCHGLDNFTGIQTAGLALRIHKRSKIKFKNIRELTQ